MYKRLFSEICRRRKSTVILLSLSLTAGLLILAAHSPSKLFNSLAFQHSPPTPHQATLDSHGLKRLSDVGHGSQPVVEERNDSDGGIEERNDSGPVNSARQVQHSPTTQAEKVPGNEPESRNVADFQLKKDQLTSRYITSSMPLGKTLRIRHNSNQSAIVDAIRHAWKGYRDYAWGTDELKPLSKTGSTAPFNMGMTLVDCLDTLWLAGLQEEFDEAREWVAEHMNIVKNTKTVSTFETTIRVLGGLLSAHHLSHDTLFLDRAVELAQRLLPVFQTPSGIPSRVVNLQHGVPKGAVKSLTVAEAGSLQLEFRDVSHATGDPSFQTACDRDMNVLLEQGKGQMMPMMINPSSGKLQLTAFSVGAGIDSYYEYLLKQWIQSGKAEDKFLKVYVSTVKDVASHLVSHSGPSHLAFIGRAHTRSAHPSSVMDHLSCFYPGTLALGLMNQLHPEQRTLAKELTHTCYSAYGAMPTGIAPEIFHFNTGSSGQDFEIRGVSSMDLSNILRPETVESLFYLYRLTGDSKYRDWGWSIFLAFEKHAKISSGGYTGLSSVLNSNSKQDKMESFFVSETLKYLFLLFTDDSNVLKLDEWVFNTEAHPLPVWRTRH